MPFLSVCHSSFLFIFLLNARLEVKIRISLSWIKPLVIMNKGSIQFSFKACNFLHVF